MGSGDRLAGLRILVAEDNEINQFVIREMLRGEGCEVALAADGEQAVALATGPGHGSFDLVLMDVQMPVLNGYEATRRIRAHLPDLPIVALTAHALAEERRMCLAAGMADIVSKPIDPRAPACRDTPPCRVGRPRRCHRGRQCRHGRAGTNRHRGIARPLAPVTRHAGAPSGLVSGYA
jgi:CheY-like chemotaxis protein